MSKFYDENISVERLSAYLDGNLSTNEMQELSTIIKNDSEWVDMMNMIDSVDDGISAYNESILPDELLSNDFELPQLESIQNIGSMNEEYDSLTNHSVFGEEGENGSSPFIQQYYNDTCAIRSQQIIMRDYGIDISEHDLRDIAMENGWYMPGEGTQLQDVGNLLEIAGVECHQSMNNTVYDLVSELSQGHRVIVGVDSGELWEKTAFGRIGEKIEDFLGLRGADHALIVAGVDVNPNNPKDIKVILTDPGSGDLRIEYKMEDFIDAWKDSNCFMVSTEQPAPYQFDPVTDSEVPSGFHTNYTYNQFVIEHGYQLSADDMTLPEGYMSNSFEREFLASNDFLHNDINFEEGHDGISFDHHDDSDFDSLDDLDFEV